MRGLDITAKTGRRVPTLPVVLTGLAIGAQVSYPVLPDAQLDRLTIAVVLTFCAASFSHACSALGRAAAIRIFMRICLLSLLAELIGVHSG
ncbi:MAG: hypothetical protein ACRC0L_04255, partial [Angustibacter sp.]